MRPKPNLRRHAMAVLWPAFLMAGVLETLVFVLVDPATLRWFGGAAVELSASAVYTLAFFVFWIVIATAGVLTQLLELTAEDVNRLPEEGPGSARPR
jgi:hypothetical protein